MMMMMMIECLGLGYQSFGRTHKTPFFIWLYLLLQVETLNSWCLKEIFFLDLDLSRPLPDFISLLTQPRSCTIVLFLLVLNSVWWQLRAPLGIRYCLCSITDWRSDYQKCASVTAAVKTNGNGRCQAPLEMRPLTPLISNDSNLSCGLEASDFHHSPPPWVPSHGK